MYFFKLNSVFIKISFLFFLTLACDNSKVVDFPLTQFVSGELVDDISIFSDGNIYLNVVDTFLVVQANNEKIFALYSTNTHELLTKFGKEGRGPGEFLGPSLMKQTGFDKTNNSPVIYAFDYKRQEINTINIFNAINNEKYNLQENLSTNSDFLPYFHYIDNDFYLASPEYKARFLKYNFNSSEIEYIPFVPEVDFSIPFNDLQSVYRSAVYVNKDKGLIVAAPYLLGQLDFFDLEGNFLHSTVLENIENNKMELEAGSDNWNNIKLQISDLDAHGDSIFALNHNNAINKFYGDKRENNVKIQIFNWSGDPIKELILDDRLITSFAVDIIHNRIYAYAPNEINSNLLIYNLED